MPLAPAHEAQPLPCFDRVKGRIGIDEAAIRNILRGIVVRTIEIEPLDDPAANHEK